ncbi:alpha-amylase family glycosyl hydrolase [Actinoplanes sp. KI2]|uniref:alpha-amylase family glycosyl hydrolase n=1 Tax=Actinoplanes sp. KI2 TaxID=2983315 RepID=UPI0021D60C45|nr:alpha-amylase family glycosyl hydrolase [Actinoplanes sp. KI2]MCU7730442.1 alpha-amylase family glycosyl hydrolase [Actinoplanes sp. KI2]
MSTGWPAAPVVYEIDTWPWLEGVSRRLGHRVTLADVPAEVWDETLPPGVDAVWLMGVWERSPAGLVVARANEDLQRSFHQALPDLKPADLVGSPYCVRRYRVDAHLGGPGGLATARAELARRGLRLVLDYVPNHVAPDHPAVVEAPDWFVHGDEADEQKEPAAWFRAAGRILAHGRDPYFPPWPDVAQLNAFSPELRTATAAALSDIAGQCDGIRCDMAMLLTNDVFARTWGGHAGPPPAEEFWPAVIGELRTHRPDVVLIAEAYWDMEWTLQQQGFDFCYDKRLYDRLAGESAAAVRGHLAAGRDYQDKLIRFIENHDEPRAATALPGGRDRAAAVAVATLPGATLWHDGEFEGRRTHLPVFLARFPDEPVDEDLQAFYRRLLAVVAGMRRGDWTMLDADGWPDNPTHADVLAWAWHDDVPHHVIAVNLSGHESQARIVLPWPALAGRRWRLIDLLDGRVFDRDGDQLTGDGLYVDLPPWGQHLLAVAPA